MGVPGRLRRGGAGARPRRAGGHQAARLRRQRDRPAARAAPAARLGAAARQPHRRGQPRARRRDRRPRRAARPRRAGHERCRRRAVPAPRPRAAARAALGLPDGPLLLYVGHLKETKGVLDLATAFVRAAARHPTLRLAVVGGGDARAGVEAILGAAPAEVRERAVLAGPRPLEDVPTWMAAADALVLASWAEGTPNVVLSRRWRRAVASSPARSAASRI
ncbi:MAG: glycosyltransferase [Kofleriaceae bacterium]|nr:glycosyltransferase [Kofleriaceae bacterium]